jgi:hypothetical protein
VQRRLDSALVVSIIACGPQVAATKRSGRKITMDRGRSPNHVCSVLP